MNRGTAPSRVAAGKDGSNAGQTNGGGPRSRKSMLPTVSDKPQSTQQGMGGGFAGSIDARRSSAYNNGGKANGPKSDPRPVTDKAFVNNCIRTVITYLSTHGYPAAVAPKTLASPTAKDFTMIVQFLFQKFDPSMKIFGKIEDDVPLFFKRINYPFAISKSALFAVGSPHSWPAVLAALTWLVELLNYNAKVEEQGGGCTSASGQPGLLEDQESATKRQFFDYICTSYRYFLAGVRMHLGARTVRCLPGPRQVLLMAHGPCQVLPHASCMHLGAPAVSMHLVLQHAPGCNAVDDEMLEQFRVKERAVADAHARIKEANSTVVAEMQAIQSQPSPLVAAQARRAERGADTEKFEKLIDNLNGVVRPGLERLCEAYRTKATELGRDLLSLREAASSMAEACSEKREENAAAEAQVAKLEAQLKAAREAQEEKVKAAGARAERLKEEVLLANSIHQYYEQIPCAKTHTSCHIGHNLYKYALKKELVNHMRRACDAEIAKLRVDLRTALEAMLQHRMYVQQKLDATAAAVRQVQQEVHQMPAAMH
ncbi:HEC/Ndc80p family-domain-containing protein [Dunaliella salina]|uniref:Kinetochore protein NDC80 n=1 Tax=Dunaliella salina TaxID=3046 RepID=A0ABQ7GRB4_DUNSA|nr:HEC/Ndc80p family-domain-containing protein [Dunaliella salina]|eukprot:KAF5837128.1 HEC/Ndc80p family-domain-containing protein [Dunaliella salina]